MAGLSAFTRTPRARPDGASAASASYTSSYRSGGRPHQLVPSDLIVYTLDDIIRFRLLMIAARHEDSTDVSLSPSISDRGQSDRRDIEVTILMPCLNEAETIQCCVRKAMGFLAESGISGEVLVADNGSTDGSQGMAEQLGARVVSIDRRGYGAALIGGIEAAAGRFVIMGDSDDSYDFTALGPFVAQLRAGQELVMGN